MNDLRSAVLFLTTVFSSGSAATAQEMPLGDYLASMDRAEISFSGSIQYNGSQDHFTFYNEDLGSFRISVDAGRQVRELIEEECREHSIFSRANSRKISGSGLVEIRGASIAISLETVDQILPAEPDKSEEEVSAALGADAEAPAVAAGPPMTGAERDSFRIAVNRCWNIDPGTVASRVTVEVGFSLGRDGRVLGNEVRLLYSDGDQSATATAFDAARLAILRCQSGGYQLPPNKYDQWKDVVITFDPDGMRLR